MLRVIFLSWQDALSFDQGAKDLAIAQLRSNDSKRKRQVWLPVLFHWIG